MSSLLRGTSAVLLTLSALWFAGCGGGSGGSTPPTGPVQILVRLSDTKGTVVDGVVAVVAGEETFRQSSTSGQASFVVPASSNYSASAFVNGLTQNKTFKATSATTTVDLVFPSGITPTPAGTIPPPPFGN